MSDVLTTVQENVMLATAQENVLLTEGVQGPPGPVGPPGPLPESTDLLAEGAANLYFTPERAVASLGHELSGKVDKVSGKGLSQEDYTTAEKTKLSGVAPGATTNATDAQLRDRSTHTGTQAIGTIEGLQSALDGKLPASDPSVTNAREWVVETVTQGEAEAGTGTSRKAWTAQRVVQAIAAWWAASSAKSKLDGVEAGAQVNTVTSVAGKTGGVTLAKGDVGLGNVDNTSDANKPVSTATQTELTLKAPLASPALTGTPTAPTAAVGTNTTQIATTAHVFAERAAVATLTNKTITGGTTNPETLQESGVAAVVQSDIGTGPNQIPLNQYLGPLAFSTDSPNLSGLSLTGPFASRVVSGTVLPAISSVIPPEFKYTTSPNAAQPASGYYFNGTFVDDRITAGGGAMSANGFTASISGYALDPVGRVALNGSSVVVRRNNALDVGANANPSSYLVGYRAVVLHSTAVPSTVATGQAIGTSSSIANQSGTIVEVIGFQSVFNMSSTGTASVTNAHGLRTSASVGSASGSQTLGSYYDAYLDGVTVSGVGAVTNKYGVYQTKADHINYFAGDVLVGRSTKSSGGKLEVSGNLVCQPAATAPSLGTNGDMTFQLLSDTSLKILVRGSDGVTRSTTLTLA